MSEDSYIRADLDPCMSALAQHLGCAVVELTPNKNDDDYSPAKHFVHQDKIYLVVPAPNSYTFFQRRAESLVWQEKGLLLTVPTDCIVPYTGVCTKHVEQIRTDLKPDTASYVLRALIGHSFPLFVAQFLLNMRYYLLPEYASEVVVTLGTTAYYIYQRVQTN